jgi:hypothetical protein
MHNEYLVADLMALKLPCFKELTDYLASEILYFL